MVTQGLRWTTDGGAQSSDDPLNPGVCVILETVLGNPVLSEDPGTNDDNRKTQAGTKDTGTGTGAHRGETMI